MFVDLKLKNLFGFILGAVIVFILSGIWEKKFDWRFFIIFIIGGLIGHFVMAFLNRRKSE